MILFAVASSRQEHENYLRPGQDHDLDCVLAGPSLEVKMVRERFRTEELDIRASRQDFQLTYLISNKQMMEDVHSRFVIKGEMISNHKRS